MRPFGTVDMINGIYYQPKKKIITRNGLTMRPGIYVYELTILELREDGTFDIAWSVGPSSLNCRPYKRIERFLRGCLYLGEV